MKLSNLSWMQAMLFALAVVGFAAIGAALICCLMVKILGIFI